MSFTALLGSADNLTAVILAGFALTAIIRPSYRKTIGSRRVAGHRLSRVVIGVPVSYVETLFGEPLLVTPWHRDDKGLPVTYRRLYDAQHGWLFLTEQDGSVVAYAFTITDPAFTYDLGSSSYQQLHGRLGRVTYKEAYPGDAVDVLSFVGANTYSYVETHYFGRPGMYQRYALSESGIGTSRSAPSSVVQLGNIEKPRDSIVRPLADRDRTAVEAHRNRARPDTIAVIGQEVNQSFVGRPGDDYTLGSDVMRRFRAAGPRGWTRERGSRRTGS